MEIYLFLFARINLTSNKKYTHTQLTREFRRRKYIEILMYRDKKMVKLVN